MRITGGRYDWFGTKSIGNWFRGLVSLTATIVNISSLGWEIQSSELCIWRAFNSLVILELIEKKMYAIAVWTIKIETIKKIEQ